MLPRFTVEQVAACSCLTIADVCLADSFFYAGISNHFPLSALGLELFGFNGFLCLRLLLNISTMLLICGINLKAFDKKLLAGLFNMALIFFLFKKIAGFLFEIYFG